MYLHTYICMYIHYCAMHAAPHPFEYTDIATYTVFVCLAILPKPRKLFAILVNYRRTGLLQFYRPVPARRIFVPLTLRMTSSTLQSPNSVSLRISGWGSLIWHLLTSSCSVVRMILDCVELMMSPFPLLTDRCCLALVVKTNVRFQSP